MHNLAGMSCSKTCSFKTLKAVLTDCVPTILLTVYYPTNREPSDDATPTETCVCVHCFPDLKALGQGNDKPLREPFSFYQQTVLHQAQIQNVDPLCTEENLHNSSSEVRAEAAVGWGQFALS